MRTNLYAITTGRAIKSILLVIEFFSTSDMFDLEVLTGFSRGAYQVRVIAGMIEKVKIYL